MQPLGTERPTSMSEGHRYDSTSAFIPAGKLQCRNHTAPSSL